MAHPELRGEAHLATARVTGRCWTIAMCAPDWDMFVDAIAPAARLRLTVVLEHFCDRGERDLPKGTFRWLSAIGQAPGSTREGAFEGHGVVLRGRAACSVFFVTSMDVDVETAAPVRRLRPGGADPRQHSLPLSFTGGRDDG